MRYLISVGDAASQLLNALVFFSFDANQSLSGRCWEHRDHWFYGPLGEGIDLIFGGGHCCEASRKDTLRAIDRAKKWSRLHGLDV